MISVLAAMMLAVSSGGTFETESQGIHLRVWLESSVYHWAVTNVDAAPISRIEFQIDKQHTYNVSIPPGWRYESVDDHLLCTTERAMRAIRPGRTEQFTVQVGVQGTVLADAAIVIGGAGDGEPIVISPVWGPVDLPRSQVVLIAGLMVLIAGGHYWLVRRRGS